jgi:hypothetical protein
MPDLEQTIILGDNGNSSFAGSHLYDEFLALHGEKLPDANIPVAPNDVLSLQLTSGENLRPSEA